MDDIDDSGWVADGAADVRHSHSGRGWGIGGVRRCGWRAARAYPERIFVPRIREPFKNEDFRIIDGLAAFGVPVQEVHVESKSALLPVLGLGYSLSQSCDLVVAAAGTKFQIREVQRGLASGQHWVATWFWTGSRFANEVALTGRMFTAEEALQHGMVSRVVPAEQTIAAAEALAAEILESPPLAVRANVRVMRWFVNEMQRQSRMYTQGLSLHLSEDFQESARAFIEKRKPTFRGR